MREVRCRTVVVGGGLTGLLAAHWAGEDAVLATSGLGATALSSATFWRAPRHADGFSELAQRCGVPYGTGRVVSGAGELANAYAPRWCLVEGGAPLLAQISGLPATAWKASATLAVDWGVPDVTWARAAARLERNPDVRGHLTRGIASLPAGDAVFPPVLGLTPSTRAAVERDAGRRLWETAGCQGALGYRLLHALWQELLGKTSVLALEEAKVVSMAHGPPHRVRLVMGKLGRRTLDVVADSVVLCTGGPLTALRQDGNVLVEPLTGIACARLDEVPEDLLAPQPAFGARLPVDRRHRVDGTDGVFASGALGAGFGLAACVDAAWEVSRQL